MHHAFQLYAHLTWHTWQRRGCLDQTAVEEFLVAARNATAVTGIRVLECAVLADHVHLLVSFRPTCVLSDFVRLVKSGSAFRANTRVPGAVRWGRGFYAATVSKSQLRRVVSYIRDQHRHHPDLIPKQTRGSANPGRQPGVYKYTGAANTYTGAASTRAAAFNDPGSS